MESVVVGINLFGAVALLLFGLAQIKDGMSRAFGARLRIGLAAGTRGQYRSFFAGLVATIALQSSTATALMVASFVEKDLIAPAMAQIVLLGANVGTAMTAWIVALGLGWLSPLLILAGVILSRGKSVQRQGGGAAVAGVGLMLLSLHLLSAATDPIRQSPALGLFIGMLGDAWPVALIFSAVLAVLASSSLAIVVLILSLAASGGMETSLVIVLVLGANLGGAVPPVLATLKAPIAARRVTVGNLVVRAIGCLAALPLAGYAAALLDMSPFSHANLAVDAHLAFNFAVAAFAWPLSPVLLRVTTMLLPDRESTENNHSYLDSHDLDQPVAALAGASREVLLVGDLIELMLRQASEACGIVMPQSSTISAAWRAGSTACSMKSRFMSRRSDRMAWPARTSAVRWILSNMPSISNISAISSRKASVRRFPRRSISASAFPMMGKVNLSVFLPLRSIISAWHSPFSPLATPILPVGWWK